MYEYIAAITASVAFVAGWRAKNLASQRDVLREQNYELLTALGRTSQELQEFKDQAAKAQRQRIAASKIAARLRSERANAAKAKREEATKRALQATAIPPRSQVVAGVIEAREAKKSSAGSAAIKGG